MLERSLFRSINVSAQGLGVQRTRMNVVSENLANMSTTKTENGDPYRRKLVKVAQEVPDEKFVEVLKGHRLDFVSTTGGGEEIPSKPFLDFGDKKGQGIIVHDVVEDMSEFKLVYDPYHPDANEEGYVRMPNINPVQEMIDLITASRSYEANVAALNSSKEMIRAALKI